MNAPIRSFVTGEDQTYYRVFSGGRNVGSFISGAPPASADQAVAGLTLPPANTAEFMQQVMVPGGTSPQSSIAAPAFGQPGGMLQFELLERLPDVHHERGSCFEFQGNAQLAATPSAAGSARGTRPTRCRTALGAA